MHLLNTWKNAQPAIKNSIGESAYETWFSSLKVSTTHPQCLTIEAPDDFYKNWVKDHYLDILKNAFNLLGVENCQIDFITSSVSTNIERYPEPVQPERPPQPSSPQRNTLRNVLSRFTFDTFVMGSSNQFAFKASQAVADSPAKAYNPLFIYGQSGMGKTHLMHAIANHVAKRTPHLSCAYLTSEQFTNELIDSIRNRSVSSFKQRYRTTDVLLIDDIQFIAGKESTQEEFFHTFNDLHNARKQIIITSDRPAKEIAKMEDRLVTRFSWGLTVDIQPPEFETRVAILRKKIEVEEVSVYIPDDVIFFIAEQIKTNIRELEGALIRVVACSLLDEKPATLELAKTVLKDMVKETTKTISIEMIMQIISEYYDLSISDLKSNRRNQGIVIPRQVGMYLSRKLTKHSLPEIGNAYGGKDHTTVLYAYQKIDKVLNTNSEIRYVVEKLTDSLKR